MEAGRELDALVAEKVMGLSVLWDTNMLCPYCGSEMRYCGSRSWCYEVCHEWRYGPYKDYSADIAAAWEVIEKLYSDGYWAELQTPWNEPRGEANQGHSCGFTPFLTTGWNGVPDNLAHGETMPLAICLAALKAKGMEVE